MILVNLLAELPAPALDAKTSTLVHVTSPPFGDPPLWVREAWIGLQLPLTAGAVGIEEVQVEGVLTTQRPASRVTIRGYRVAAVDAFAALERAGRSAAVEWWYEHSPTLLRPGHELVFDEACCVVRSEEGAP